MPEHHNDKGNYRCGCDLNRSKRNHSGNNNGNSNNNSNINSNSNSNIKNGQKMRESRSGPAPKVKPTLNFNML